MINLYYLLYKIEKNKYFLCKIINSYLIYCKKNSIFAILIIAYNKRTIIICDTIIYINILKNK